MKIDDINALFQFPQFDNFIASIFGADDLTSITNLMQYDLINSEHTQSERTQV